MMKINENFLKLSESYLFTEVARKVNAPYLWVSTSDSMNSWDFFDMMLHSAHVVCTPGVGFGTSGEGFVRLTAFGTHESTKEALRRMVAVLNGKS